MDFEFDDTRFSDGREFGNVYHPLLGEFNDDFSGTGPLDSTYHTYNASALPDVQRRDGYFHANLDDNSIEQTLWYNGSRGRLDYKFARFPTNGTPAEIIFENMGIGPDGNPQANLPFVAGGFAFIAVVVGPSAFTGEHYQFLALGHRDLAQGTAEHKTTIDLVSSVDDEGSDIFGAGVTHGDVRLRLFQNGTVEFAYAPVGSNSWTLINSGTGIPSAAGGIPAFGSDGDPLVVGIAVYCQETAYVPYDGTIARIVSNGFGDATNLTVASQDSTSELTNLELTSNSSLEANSNFSDLVQENLGLTSSSLLAVTSTNSDQVSENLEFISRVEVQGVPVAGVFNSPGNESIAYTLDSQVDGLLIFCESYNSLDTPYFPEIDIDGVPVRQIDRHKNSVFNALVSYYFCGGNELPAPGNRTINFSFSNATVAEFTYIVIGLKNIHVESPVIDANYDQNSVVVSSEAAGALIGVHYGGVGHTVNLADGYELHGEFLTPSFKWVVASREGGPGVSFQSENVGSFFYHVISLRHADSDSRTLIPHFADHSHVSDQVLTSTDSLLNVTPQVSLHDDGNIDWQIVFELNIDDQNALSIADGFPLVSRTYFDIANVNSESSHSELGRLSSVAYLAISNHVSLSGDGNIDWGIEFLLESTDQATQTVIDSVTLASRTNLNISSNHGDSAQTPVGDFDYKYYLGVLNQTSGNVVTQINPRVSKLLTVGGNFSGVQQSVVNLAASSRLIVSDLVFNQVASSLDLLAKYYLEIGSQDSQTVEDVLSLSSSSILDPIDISNEQFTSDVYIVTVQFIAIDLSEIFLS